MNFPTQIYVKTRMLKPLLVLTLLSVSIQCGPTQGSGEYDYARQGNCDLSGYDVGPGPFPDFAKMVTATLLESDKEYLRNGTCTGTQKAFPNGVAGNLSSVEIEKICTALDPDCLHSCVANAKGEAAYMLYYQVMAAVQDIGEGPEQACTPSPLDPRAYWNCLKLPSLPDRFALFLNWMGDSIRPTTVHLVGDFLAGAHFIHISGRMHDQGCNVEGFEATVIPRVYEDDHSSYHFRDRCSYEVCRIRDGQYVPTQPAEPWGRTRNDRIPTWKSLLMQNELTR